MGILSSRPWPSLPSCFPDDSFPIWNATYREDQFHYRTTSGRGFHFIKCYYLDNSSANKLLRFVCLDYYREHVIAFLLILPPSPHIVFLM